jgi:hypothetical protein
VAAETLRGVKPRMTAAIGMDINARAAIVAKGDVFSVLEEDGVV